MPVSKKNRVKKTNSFGMRKKEKEKELDNRSKKVSSGTIYDYLAKGLEMK